MENCRYDLTMMGYFVDAKEYLAGIENWNIIPCILCTAYSHVNCVLL
jgi:hypothetical protein